MLSAHIELLKGPQSKSSGRSLHSTQANYSGSSTHSGSGRSVSPRTPGSQNESKESTNKSEQKLNTGYRAISTKQESPPKAPPLSKSGQKFEKIQLQMGKNSVNVREKYLNRQIKNSNDGLAKTIPKEEWYKKKMKSAKRNPNSISGKIRSIFPGTMEHKHQRAVKQSNKHASALTDVIHDTRIYNLHNGMSDESAQQINKDAHGALRQRYAIQK